MYQMYMYMLLVRFGMWIIRFKKQDLYMFDFI